VKRPFSKQLLSGWSGLAALLLTLVLSGCATAEPDNLSARPWNSPQGWETGLPSSMTQGK
jgi:hypothetical protein